MPEHKWKTRQEAYNAGYYDGVDVGKAGLWSDKWLLFSSLIGGAVVYLAMVI